MPLRRLQQLSSTTSGQQLNGQDDQADDKDKKTDPVDPVHITDPFVLGTVRVFFPEIEIF